MTVVEKECRIDIDPDRKIAVKNTVFYRYNPEPPKRWTPASLMFNTSKQHRRNET